MRGTVADDDIYYTNSIHIRPDADVDLITRIRKQAKFHGLIESGAIIHAFVGENRPSAGAIASLVEKTFNQTQAAQLTISPEFTVCKVCNHMTMGLTQKCGYCGAANYMTIERTDISQVDAMPWNRETFAELARMKQVVEKSPVSS